MTDMTFFVKHPLKLLEVTGVIHHRHSIWRTKGVDKRIQRLTENMFINLVDNR
jgi:hypothetical protein